MYSAAESLFATLFPADCRLCQAPLLNISRLPVCPQCLAAMQPISVQTCSLCGERLVSPCAVQDPRCGMCRRVEPAFTRAVAYGSYDGGLRELLHLLKYEDVRPAAAVLGRMLGEAIRRLEPDFGDRPVLVVPVPLHREKLRRRGFNQAELLAGQAVASIGKNSRMKLNTRVLTRRRATQSQTGLTRHQRRQNVRGAFVVSRPEKIQKREVLLIDDVFTTGTTLSECARVLRRAGASKVWVATVARTLKAGAEPLGRAQPDEDLVLAAHG